MCELAATAALRSDARLVVIEAPAGCGKTFQAASFATDRANLLRPGRMLILTHTHAACDVIAKRGANPSDTEIRTIDSLAIQVGTAYHRALDLPPDVSAWARENADGYDEVAGRVTTLITRTPRIADALAKRYPVVVCDEHQDSSAHQHQLVMHLLKAGSFIRIFGDPMQSIYSKKDEFAAASDRWKKLCAAADIVETLDVAHRWTKVAPALGEWIQAARAALRDGGVIDLRGKLPANLTLIRADNHATGFGNYRLDPVQRKPVDAYLKADGSLLVLAAHNKTVAALRGVFARRLPIWEGHTRSALDGLVREVAAKTGEPAAIGRAFAAFLGRVAVGFTASGFGDRFIKEIETGAAKPCKGKPATLQGLAKVLLAEPNYRGVACALRLVEELAAKDEQFKDVKIDHAKEFREAIHLGEFADVSTGHSEVTRRRTVLRPAPPQRALSTVHKAKGLECERVLVLPCDKTHFSDKPDHRCLLYVALSRAVRDIALVVPAADASPLVRV